MTNSADEQNQPDNNLGRGYDWELQCAAGGLWGRNPFLSENNKASGSPVMCEMASEPDNVFGFGSPDSSLA